jgi:hypothetical protein
MSESKEGYFTHVLPSTHRLMGVALKQIPRGKNIVGRQLKLLTKGKVRTSTGGALLFAVGGLIILTFILALGVLFLTNVGIAAYYRDKVDFVAREGAEIAAGALSWADSPRVISTGQGKGRLATVDDATAQTVPVVQALCKNMGLPVPSASDIEVSADNTQATVRVTIRGLVMAKGNSIFPSFINMTATEQKTFDEDRPPAFTTFSIGHSVTTCVAMPQVFAAFDVLVAQVGFTLPSQVIDFRAHGFRALRKLVKPCRTSPGFSIESTESSFVTPF